MKSILSSRYFWCWFTLGYFFLMTVACIIAEGHLIGGGGNSDVTVWSFQWQWSSIAELHTFYMVSLLFIIIFPWLYATYNPPQKKSYSVLLSIHLILNLLLGIIYIGSVMYGLLTDVDSHFDDWSGVGIYPSPIDKYESEILLHFYGPIAFIFGLIVTLIGIIKKDY